MKICSHKFIGVGSFQELNLGIFETLLGLTNPSACITTIFKGHDTQYIHINVTLSTNIRQYFINVTPDILTLLAYAN